MGTGEGSEPLSSKPESGSDFLSTYNYDPLSRPAFRLSLASDFNFCLPLFGHVLPLIEKITPELYHTIQFSLNGALPFSISAIDYCWFSIQRLSVASCVASFG